MWRLGLGGGGLPERPGEADCLFYLRTGSCGYGEKCRFNHPRDCAVATEGVRIGVMYPERPDQPLCQYFLKTGTCKFGATCKYHHPKQGVSVDLNIHGYPLHPREKDCSYYVKTGQCKFGVTCKFHHPQPAGPSVPTPAPPFYPPVQSPSAHTPQPYPVLQGWQPGRPPLVPGSYMQGAFSPMVFPPGLFPVPGWNSYPTSGSSVVSPGGQQTIQAGSMYGGITQQLSASAPAYISPYPLVPPLAGPSSSSPKEHNFPERPGQPECQFYMRTGDCKFGPSCRYHHPPGWSVPQTTCALSLIGLPLRPGAPTCTYYSQHGVCKFGPTCKFDHPMGILNYSPPVSSTDVPFVPYIAGFSTANLTPSSSSSDIRAETFTAPSNSESLSMHVQLPGNSSNGSIGSLFSTDRSVSQPFVPTTGQSSTSLSSGSSIGHGGKVGGSG